MARRRSSSFEERDIPSRGAGCCRDAVDLALGALERAATESGTEGQVYLFGGFIRDALRGEPFRDVDVVCVSGTHRFEGFLRAFESIAGVRPFLSDKRFDLYRYALSTGKEVLSLDIQRATKLERFLRERDFTVNALALPLGRVRQFLRTQDTRLLIDVVGGIENLREGILDTCSPRTLEADPVRIVRAARYAAVFGFRIPRKTRAQARACAPALARTPPERVMQEELEVAREGARAFARHLRDLRSLRAYDFIFRGTTYDEAVRLARFLAQAECGAPIPKGEWLSGSLLIWPFILITSPLAATFAASAVLEATAKYERGAPAAKAHGGEANPASANTATYAAHTDLVDAGLTLEITERTGPQTGKGRSLARKPGGAREPGISDKPTPSGAPLPFSQGSVNAVHESPTGAKAKSGATEDRISRPRVVRAQLSANDLSVVIRVAQAAARARRADLAPACIPSISCMTEAPYFSGCHARSIRKAMGVWKHALEYLLAPTGALALDEQEMVALKAMGIGSGELQYAYFLVTTESPEAFEICVHALELFLSHALGRMGTSSKWNHKTVEILGGDEPGRTAAAAAARESNREPAAAPVRLARKKPAAEFGAKGDKLHGCRLHSESRVHGGETEGQSSSGQSPYVEREKKSEQHNEDDTEKLIGGRSQELTKESIEESSTERSEESAENHIGARAEKRRGESAERLAEECAEEQKEEHTAELIDEHIGESTETPAQEPIEKLNERLRDELPEEPADEHFEKLAEHLPEEFTDRPADKHTEKHDYKLTERHDRKLTKEHAEKPACELTVKRTDRKQTNPERSGPEGEGALSPLSNSITHPLEPGTRATLLRRAHSLWKQRNSQIILDWWTVTTIDPTALEAPANLREKILSFAQAILIARVMGD